MGIAAINVSYYLFFYGFAFAKLKKDAPKSLPPISVVVCAKNEAENLKENIPLLLKQAYPTFEIVLINDASYDETEEVMEAFVKTNANVVQVNVENIEAFWGNKKYALTLGIKKAQYPNLLFVDADCKPSSDLWIQKMAAGFDTGHDIVLGYGGYTTVKGSFVNMLTRFETVVTAMQYFAYAIAGKPYMGVGRNLGYTKELFFEQRGFINHMKVQSGDDDLFVNQASTSNNTATIFSEDSFTISDAKTTFRDWIIQKRRHISVSKYYKWSDKFLLGLFYSSQLFFFVLSGLLLALQFNWEWVLGIIGLRYIISWFAVGGSALKFKEKDLLWFYPVMELFLVLFQLSIFSINLFSKPNRWK